MAISWGPTSNHGRLGYEVTKSGTTATIGLYYQSVAYGHSWTNTVTLSGSWAGTVSFQFYSGFGQTVTKLITKRTLTFTGSRSFSASIGGFGAASISFTVTNASATPKPTAPSALRVASRNGDASVTLNWTRNSTYTAVVVQRRTGSAGAWTQMGVASGNAATYTNSTIFADSAFYYRVAGRNAGGQSAWSNIAGPVYTTPKTPTTPKVSRTGAGAVTVAWTYQGSFKLGAQVERSDGATWDIGTGTNAAPTSMVDSSSAGVGIKYRVRAYLGGSTGRVYSAWSAWSAAITTIAPPNAPTALTPNGGSVSTAAPLTFSWKHNPTDSSPQQGSRGRWRTAGSNDPWSYWLANVQALNEAFTPISSQWESILNAGPRVEWQVQTRGLAEEYGPYSAVATFTLVEPPTVNLTSPTGIVTSGYLRAVWTAQQATNIPPSAWTAVLANSEGETLETLTGTGNPGTCLFATPLEDGGEYTLAVRVACNGVWSPVEDGQVAFRVEFIPPAVPGIEGEWDEALGAHLVSVDAGAAQEEDFGLVTLLVGGELYVQAEE